MSSFIEIASVRKARKNYIKELENIEKDGVCPFCSKNIKHYHKNPIETKNSWLTTENSHPYTKGKKHLLLIPKRHISKIEEFKENEWKELLKIFKKYLKDKKVINGGFFVKFGNTASIKHLHFHIVEDTRIGKIQTK